MGKRRNYNYLGDVWGLICLNLAQNCKSPLKFGAVLVKDGYILGQGWNRKSTVGDRRMLRHLDYACHAEQAALIQALRRFGKELVRGSTIYVIGEHKGELTTRKEKVFVCQSCPHNFIRYGVNVCIPHEKGWMEMTGEEALETGRAMHRGYWKDFQGKRRIA